MKALFSPTNSSFQFDRKRFVQFDLKRFGMSCARVASVAWIPLVLIGCAVSGPPKPLYSWETFQRQQYEALALEGTSSPDAQIQLLEAQAEKARATDAALPPGFRAHLGLLYLNNSNPSKARELWEAEKASFPESAPYMNTLLKRLSTPITSKVHTTEHAV